MFLWAKSIYAIAGVGIFMLVNGYRPRNGSTWAKQFCVQPEGCLYPEWILVGLACLIGACLMYTSRDPWQL